MEETQEEWKGYIITRSGCNWKVRHCKKYVGGTFTMLEKARAYVDAQVVNSKQQFYEKELRRIRKIKDLKQRSKEYKLLCQTVNSLQLLSQAG